MVKRNEIRDHSQPRPFPCFVTANCMVATEELQALDKPCGRPQWLPSVDLYISSSGFSFGFCINKDKVIWYQLELGK